MSVVYDSKCYVSGFCFKPIKCMCTIFFVKYVICLIVLFSCLMNYLQYNSENSLKSAILNIFDMLMNSNREETLCTLDLWFTLQI